MDQNERSIIDDLFDRLRKAEEQSAPRDAEAEAQIARRVAGQPAAPYYMAQAIVAQQDALARAQTRIQDLERQLTERRSGGFLGGLFGGEEAQTPVPARDDRRFGGLGRDRSAHAGGGFLAGAMQTALGVASGFLIADALSALLTPDEAAAGAPDATPPHSPEDGAFNNPDPDLSGEDTGGDVDAGGFDDF